MIRYGLTVLFLTGLVHAEAPKSESAQASIKTSKTNEALIMKVEPSKGTHLNYDGPWKLEIKGDLPLVNEKGVYGIEAFDKEKESFTIPLLAKPSAKSKGDYKLIYFICSDDKSWCKRTETAGTL